MGPWHGQGFSVTPERDATIALLTQELARARQSPQLLVQNIKHLIVDALIYIAI